MSRGCYEENGPMKFKLYASVTLVDCDNKCKWAHYMIDQCLGYLRAKVDRNRRNPVNPSSTEEDQWDVGKMCTSAAMISA